MDSYIKRKRVMEYVVNLIKDVILDALVQWSLHTIWPDAEQTEITIIQIDNMEICFWQKCFPL